MNYKIIGQDGKEYGPITGDQMRQWISENRVESRTPVFVDGTRDWTFAGLLPEFAALFSNTAPQNPPTIAPPSQPRKINGFAIAGLICGILSLLCCLKILTGALGVTFSLIALSRINREPERYEGRELAYAGIILSVLGILFSLTLIILWQTTNLYQYLTFYKYGQ